MGLCQSPLYDGRVLCGEEVAYDLRLSCDFVGVLYPYEMGMDGLKARLKKGAGVALGLQAVVSCQFCVGQVVFSACFIVDEGDGGGVVGICESSPT